MAWRIDISVVRGEIDNRTKGIVKGRLWFHDVSEPVAFELAGNACSDLAGCLLEFENQEATHPLPREFTLAGPFRGVAGDVTASRKVRLAEHDDEGTITATDKWGNAMYLEWFLPAHGRMVIESTDFRLRVSAPEWKLSGEEEAERKRASEAAFLGFLDGLDAALSKAESQTPSADKPDWDEFDYEKLLRESDARSDKYSELLDRYMDHPDREEIVGRLMGWDESGDGDEAEPGLATEGGAESEPAADDRPLHLLEEEGEDDLKPDPATEGVDWVREPDGDISHPLSLRVFNSSMALWRAAKSADASGTAELDLDELVGEFQITGAKLAGVLDTLAYGRDLEHGPFIVATLKRALSHLHRAQGALERVTPRQLLRAETVTATRKELFEIREEILRLMQEFRAGDK